MNENIDKKNGKIVEKEIKSLYSKNIDNSDTIGKKEIIKKPIAEATIIFEEQNISKENSKENNVSINITNEEIKKVNEGVKLENNKSILLKYVATFYTSKLIIIGYLCGTIIAIVLFRSEILKFKTNNENVNNPFLPIYIGSIEKSVTDYIFLERFIILLEQEKKKTYLIADIVVIPSNENVYKEIKDKVGECRSVIYNVLKEEAKKNEEVVEEILKERIKKALNKIITYGNIESIIFDQLLGV